MEADNTLQASTRLVNHWRTIELVLVVCSFLLAIAVGLFVTRTVTRQLRQLSDGIQVIGAGNLEHRVDTGIGDEIGQLSRAFDKMTETLSGRDRSIREKEERFRGLFEQSNDGIVFCTPEGKILDLNQQMTEMLGFSREVLLAMSFFELHFPLDQDILRRLFSALKPGKRIQLESEQRTADDGEVIVEINATTSGPQAGIIQMVIRDITDRVRANRELEHQMEAISEGSRRLEALVSNTTEREMKMVQLKQEVNDLLEETGQVPKYGAPAKVAGAGLEEALNQEEGGGPSTCR